MAFEIQSIDNDEWLVRFKFSRSSCELRVQKVEDDDHCIYVNSLTDGFHWLQYWMCQHPGVTELESLPFDDEIRRINAVFKYIGMYWEQEDKETAFIHADRVIDDYDINQVMIIMDERFAQRERFF